MFHRLLEMKGLIIDLAVLPQFPGHSQPTISETTIGVLSGRAVRPDTFPIGCCPCRLAQRGSGPLLGEVAKILVTRSAETNDAAFAAHFGHWTGTCKGLDVLGRGKMLAIVTEFG